MAGRGRADLQRPATSTFRQIRRISVSENSSPTVKSSSTIPISDSTSTSSCVFTMPMPVGPATAPATMNETIGGSEAGSEPG